MDFYAFDEAIPAHLHDSWEVKAVLGGTLSTYLPGRQRVALESPHVQLIAPRTVHVTDTSKSMSPGCCYLNCCFDGAETWVARIRNDGREGMYLTAPQTAHWRSLLDNEPELVAARIASFVQRATRFHAEAAAGALRTFFATLAIALRVTETDAPETKRASPADRAQAYILQNYHDASLSVGEVAEQAKVTPTYLAALFRKSYGITVRQAIVRARMQRARSLLESGDYSVKETAWLTGWRSPFYFSSSFKGFYGVSPSEIHVG